MIFWIWQLRRKEEKSSHVLRLREILPPIAMNGRHPGRWTEPQEGGRFSLEQGSTSQAISQTRFIDSVCPSTVLARKDLIPSPIFDRMPWESRILPSTPTPHERENLSVDSPKRQERDAPPGGPQEESPASQAVSSSFEPSPPSLFRCPSLLLRRRSHRGHRHRSHPLPGHHERHLRLQHHE